jgi:hypothetical protein
LAFLTYVNRQGGQRFRAILLAQLKAAKIYQVDILSSRRLSQLDAKGYS